MIIYMNIKQLGARKNKIKKVPFEYENAPKTLRELIEETVKICIKDFNIRMDKGDFVLSDEAISDMASIGKIAFGITYTDRRPDLEESIEVAISGFKDGLFRVFLNDSELEELDRKVKFSDGDEMTFIRLTFLAGRMF